MTLSEFITTLAGWYNWPDLDRDRPSLLLAAALATEIGDKSTEDGPVFWFIIDGGLYDWFEGEGWDTVTSMESLLNLVASRWAAGTLPVRP